MFYCCRPKFLKSKFDCRDSGQKPFFIKDMFLGMSPSWYQYLPDKSSAFKYLFLIRNPVKVYTSYRKMAMEHILALPEETFAEMGIEKPTPETFHVIESIPVYKDVSPYFFEGIHGLWNHIRKNVDEDAVVLDIDDLLNDPSSMLPRLFEVLGIPYSERLLTWDQSSDVVLKWRSCCPNVRDSPRYAGWFTKALESSCFMKPSDEPSLEDATEDVREVVNRDMPFYREMYAARLTL